MARMADSDEGFLVMSYICVLEMGIGVERRFLDGSKRV